MTLYIFPIALAILYLLPVAFIIRRAYFHGATRGAKILFAYSVLSVVPLFVLLFFYLGSDLEGNFLRCEDILSPGVFKLYQATITSISFYLFLVLQFVFVVALLIRAHKAAGNLDQKMLYQATRDYFAAALILTVFLSFLGAVTLNTVRDKSADSSTKGNLAALRVQQALYLDENSHYVIVISGRDPVERWSKFEQVIFGSKDRMIHPCYVATRNPSLQYDYMSDETGQEWVATGALNRFLWDKEGGRLSKWCVDSKGVSRHAPVDFSVQQLECPEVDY